MLIWTIVSSILGTLVVTILVLNFRKPEKEPPHRVERCYELIGARRRGVRIRLPSCGSERALSAVGGRLISSSFCGGCHDH